MAGVGDLERGFDARQAAIDGHERVKYGIELDVGEPVVAIHNRVVRALASACALCSKRRRCSRSLPVAGQTDHGSNVELVARFWLCGFRRVNVNSPALTPQKLILDYPNPK